MGLKIQPVSKKHQIRTRMLRYLVVLSLVCAYTEALQCYSCGYMRRNMSSEMEALPDMKDSFCNDFANPQDNVVECNDPGDCCASMREEHIIYDEATKQNTTDLIGRHGCKQELNHLPHPEQHKCVEHQNECYNVDLSTLPDNDNVTITNVELCFCTTDKCNQEDPIFPEITTTSSPGSGSTLFVSLTAFVLSLAAVARV